MVPRKFTTVMAEWLSRWTSDQMVVGSTPITDDLIFLCQIFLNYNIHAIFPSLCVINRVIDFIYIFYNRKRCTNLR